MKRQIKITYTKGSTQVCHIRRLTNKEFLTNPHRARLMEDEFIYTGGFNRPNSKKAFPEID